MAIKARYVHTNIVAKDWKKLAKFYVKVFGCKRKPPERNLKGDWLDDLTSLKDARVQGIHLSLPGYDKAGPTLEIFHYARTTKQKHAGINEPGIAHIAFSVSDVKEALAEVKRNGGSSVGSLVSGRIRGVGTIEVVYARDPEGNIIEIQKWE